MASSFRHEQEAGVSHHHDRRVVRVRHFGADRRRQLVAQSARAPRCQVAPRAVDVLNWPDQIWVMPQPVVKMVLAGKNSLIS